MSMLTTTLCAVCLLQGDPGPLAKRWSLVKVEECLTAPGAWRPFPRGGAKEWSGVPVDARKRVIERGTQWLAKPWPQLRATVFLDYARNGNRSRYQAGHFGRRRRLAEQVLAEVLEGKGRFLDDIVDGIWLVCEETYWGVPAHVEVQKAGVGLPDANEPTVDLFAAETGALLAWTVYLLGTQLDGVSKLVRKRITREVDRRILEPCRTRNDFWWMGVITRNLNNWTPWVCSNWLTATLLLETNAARRAADVRKIIRILDRFLVLQPADGGCDEGPGYWNRAGGSLFDCLWLLASASGGKLDAFALPLVREMGRFLPRVCLAGDWYVNFADSSPRVKIDAELVWRYGRAIGDDTVMAFASAVARRAESTDERRLRFGSLGRALPALSVTAEMRRSKAGAGLPRDVWFPQLQVLVSRQVAGATTGFTMAAKGGHNGENHNHNDVGNFIVFHDGRPVIVDAGVGTYTRETFSSRRYEIWTMRSLFHNLPAPNGVEQRAGRRFAAKLIQENHVDKVSSLVLELAGAYPPAARVRSLVRRVALDRGAQRVEVRDTLRLCEGRRPSQWIFLTPRRAVVDDGTVLLSDEGAKTVALAYVPRQLRVRVAPVQFDDNKLEKAWPDGLRRVTFELPEVHAEADVRFRLTAVR